MRTAANLEPEAYLLTKTLAAEQHISLGKVLGESLLGKIQPSAAGFPRYSKDAEGFPTIYLGRSITSEEVAAAIEKALSSLRHILELDQALWA